MPFWWEKATAAESVNFIHSYYMYKSSIRRRAVQRRLSSSNIMPNEGNLDTTTEKVGNLVIS